MPLLLWLLGGGTLRGGGGSGRGGGRGVYFVARRLRLRYVFVMHVLDLLPVNTVLCNSMFVLCISSESKPHDEHRRRPLSAWLSGRLQRILDRNFILQEFWRQGIAM